MKLTQLKNTKWKYSALAFMIPFVGLLVLRLISSICFNGQYSMLYSDQYHQYYPFFVAFRNALRSGDSLLFSWDVGMGMDYLGLISYYLASPLNLLTVILPESMMLGYFSALMPIKLSLASLFFSIFLKKLYSKDDYSLCIFGSFYGLCAWALGYQWNIMWLDTFALLPLVALGAIFLLRDKKFILYTITLFLSLFSNYYIGFFTCIFVLLTFICYQICRWSGFKRFCADFIRIAAFSALAIALTAVLFLPALKALGATESSVNTFPNTFRLNIVDQHNWKGLLDAMRQVAGNMNGGLTPTFKEGLPNLYCGVFANLLAILFLTSRRVKLRDKLCTTFLLLFFNVSFVIRQLDFIWHGFHFTNMIPYRFSFLYSFVVLYMAYRAWLIRKSFRIWQILTAALVAVTLICLNSQLFVFRDLLAGNIALYPWNQWQSIQDNIGIIAENSVYIVYNLGFLLLYTVVMLFTYRWKKPPVTTERRRKQKYLQDLRYRRNMGSAVLCGIMTLELIANIINFGVSFPGTNVSNYPLGKKDTAAVIDYMNQDDELFYRAEVSHAQTLNDGALNGYHGISTFTSSANVRVTKFMQALGYGAKASYNRYCYEESSPVADLFLGLKYMIERTGRQHNSPYFTNVYSSGSVQLLKNQMYLPLGFLADNQLTNFSFDMLDNRFTFQNNLMRTATGIQGKVWHELGEYNLFVTGEKVMIDSQSNTGYCNYTPIASGGGRLTYTYTADREGMMCIHLDLTRRNNFYVTHNGTVLYNESFSLPQMLAVDYVQPGDIVEVVLTCSSGESGAANIHAAILDANLFQQCYDILSASTLELTHFSNTRIEGTISCNRDGVLYTSIPQDGNWTAYVDGEPATISLIGDAMCGLLLTEGTHTVVFRYQNKAFELGWKISLGALLLLAAAYITYYRPQIKPRKGKFEH